MSLVLTFLLLLFTCFGSKIFANERLKLNRLSGTVEVDGLSNEAAWQQIPPLPLTMFTPRFQGEPTERTEIRVAYDDHYLYVSGRLYDSNPKGIQGNSLVRDLDRGGDFLNLLLDTFNDNETLLAFVTTPTGNRLDAEIINDAEGTDFFNQNWNGFWDCAVVQNEEGWFAEMRIPFASLRFQDVNGEVVFGLMVHRLIGRKNERLTFPAVRPNWATAQWKASLARDVVLEGVYSRKPLYFSPYLLGGVERYESSDPISQTAVHDNLNRELGLDIKYGLTNNLSLDVTLNTDFAQAEADNAQLNLTRFSLFFPEKRQFFQERSGIFSYKTGEVSRLFHSRRIGLTDDGGSVRITAGARLVGRVGEWDVGFLNMQTARTAEFPSENLGVLRLRKRVVNETSFIGGMATNRVQANGSYNFTYAFDGSLNLFDSDYLLVKWAHVLQNLRNQKHGLDWKDGSFFSLFYERRKERGLGFQSELRRSGQDFNPGLGFTLRNNFLLLRNGISYGQFPGKPSAIRKHTIALVSSFYLRNTNKSVESALNVLSWNLEFKSGHSTSLEMQWHHEDLTSPFVIDSKARVPRGSHTFLNAKASLVMSDGKRLRTNASVEIGSFYDGNRVAAMLSPTYIQSSHLELSAEYEFNRIRFSQRSQALDSHLLRLKVLSALNRRLSGNALVQYSSLANTMGVNARIRYNFSEGHDLYLLYNETFRDDLTRPRTSVDYITRTLLVKYIYTLTR